MLIRHVALVSEKTGIKMRELSSVAAALQKQATRDLGPIWQIEATVTAFENLDDLPLDYWPVVVMDKIPNPDAAGYHEDENGQPFALVQYSSGWSLTASHEVLEMLVDPFGRRLVAGESPVKGQGRVRFLVEVCDPSEADEYSYKVNGVKVSDFYTPHYFEPKKATGVRYSFTDSLTEPKQVLRGGYLSWYVSETKTWWQRTWFSGSKPVDQALKGFKVNDGNLRAALDRLNDRSRSAAMKRGASEGESARAALTGRRAGTMSDVLQSPARAQMLRTTIARVTRRK